MPHSRAPYPSRTALALLLSVLPAIPACSKPTPSGPRPDVVMIVIDTLRADRLGCYGYPRPTSPNIDALAAEGALFRNVAAQAPWTLVSMTSMVSGRYVTAHREFPDEDWPTLAESFQEAGYRTVGASANPLLDEEAGFARGFEHYRYYGPGSDYGKARDMERLVESLWAPIDAATTPSADGERPPLFLYIQPFDPHASYQSHPEFDDSLPRHAARPLQPDGWHAQQLDEAGIAGDQDDPGFTRALKQFAIQRGRYDQEVRYVDQQLEILLEGLRERGLLDDAVIAIVADHGEGLWDHVMPGADPDGKQSTVDKYFVQGHGHDLYQPATLTPFILWGRDVPAGVEIDQPVENIDLFATLQHIAGVPRTRGTDGNSLVRLMRDEEEDWRRYSFSFVRHCASVYDHETGLKLIAATDYGRSGGLQDELYHLPDDPLERNDLLEERPEDVERMRAELERWMERHPTESTLGIKRSKSRQKQLGDLGYTEEHAPGLDDEEDDDKGGDDEPPADEEREGDGR